MKVLGPDVSTRVVTIVREISMFRRTGVIKALVHAVKRHKANDVEGQKAEAIDEVVIRIRNLSTTHVSVRCVEDKQHLRINKEDCSSLTVLV